MAQAVASINKAIIAAAQEPDVGDNFMDRLNIVSLQLYFRAEFETFDNHHFHTQPAGRGLIT